MSERFLDSSALYAIVDHDNVAGPIVEREMKGQRAPVVISNLVFAESISLITKRLGKAVAITAGAMVRESRIARIIYLDEPTQDEAWALYKKYRDKDFDFIDASSFVLCRRLGIRDVLTLDRHFAQMGFTVVPK